jgi:hypothetical protein
MRKIKFMICQESMMDKNYLSDIILDSDNRCNGYLQCYTSQREFG